MTEQPLVSVGIPTYNRPARKTRIGWQTLDIGKERLMAWLREHGIDSHPFFYPLSSLPVYEHLGQARQAR